LQQPKFCCWRIYTNKNDPQSFGGGDGIHQLKKEKGTNLGTEERVRELRTLVLKTNIELKIFLMCFYITFSFKKKLSSKIKGSMLSLQSFNISLSSSYH
jgi:hypothetical protein